MPPDFTHSEASHNVSLVLSQSTSLVCDVTGSPTPVITWYKEEMPVCQSLHKFLFMRHKKIMISLKVILEKENDALKFTVV